MMSYFIVIGVVLRVLLPAWLMDRLFGDPVSLPHPVIWFGKMIAFGEKRLNKGSYKLWKGGIMSVLLILFVYSVTIGIEYAPQDDSVSQLTAKTGHKSLLSPNVRRTSSLLIIISSRND